MPSSTPASHLPPSSSRWSWSTGERGQLTSVGWLARHCYHNWSAGQLQAPSPEQPAHTTSYRVLPVGSNGGGRRGQLDFTHRDRPRPVGLDPEPEHTLGHLTDLRTLERADLVAEVAQFLAVDVEHVHDEVRLAAMAQLKAHPCSSSLVRPGDAVAPAAGRRRQAASRSRPWLLDPDGPRPIGLDVEQVATRVEVLAGRAVGGADLVDQIADLLAPAGQQV